MKAELKQNQRKAFDTANNAPIRQKEGDKSYIQPKLTLFIHFFVLDQLNYIKSSRQCKVCV